ncbi:hypothetical protein O9Z70_02105 [Devosia sp. YIM 151766]|uniref:hypothetical protein n=1 Tax=Devosia sp. YIM 151766 TaxID=3017325 RepID=UPI00255CE8B8|nr:hypothetical protein [Devosia sp. YIM 151766]WIY53352.1 hypothetical protein O9Z70_02105 [Devosia sp. YIM 151766]
MVAGQGRIWTLACGDLLVGENGIMKILRAATMFAVAFLCAPAQAQFMVEVNPVGGSSFLASLGRPGGQNPLSTDAPSQEAMSDRLSQLLGMGYFPAGGQAPDMSQDELRQMLAAYLGTDNGSGYEDMAGPSWASDMIASLPANALSSNNLLTPEQLDAHARALLGLDMDDASTVPSLANARTPAQLAQQQAMMLAEERQRKLMLLEEQQRRQVEEMARVQLEAKNQAQRETLLAEIIKRQEQAKPGPDRDRFENYPFFHADDRTPGDVEMLRSADYRGFARGTGFGDDEINGSVFLRFDLDGEGLSGQFDFGSSGMLHVAGGIDAGVFYMGLDEDRTSSFKGHALDWEAGVFDDVSFFGPRAEEIGGNWSINNEHGTAEGRFATARTTP